MRHSCGRPLGVDPMLCDSIEDPLLCVNFPTDISSVSADVFCTSNRLPQLQAMLISLFLAVGTSWVGLIELRPVTRTHSLVEVCISASWENMISAISRPADVSRR